MPSRHATDTPLIVLHYPLYFYINTSRVFIEIVQCCGCITLTQQQCVEVHVVGGEMSLEPYTKLSCVYCTELSCVLLVK